LHPGIFEARRAWRGRFFGEVLQIGPVKRGIGP
jgi:hypothetical protein